MYGRPGGMDCSADTTDTILLLDYEEKRKQIEKKSESHDAVGSGIVAFFVVSYADALKHGFQNITILEKTAKIGLIICCWNTECVSEKIAIR